MSQFQTGLPGVRAVRTASHRRVLASENYKRVATGIQVIDGTKSRDPGNTGNVDVLRAGKVMGRITSGGKWAPSYFGLTSEALTSTETDLDLPEAVGDELVRRVGSSGTFKLIGPPTAAGTVRAATVTYSAIAAASNGLRVATITAIGVNEVQTLTFGAAATGGTMRLRVPLANGTMVTTDAITWNATDATWLAAINTALDAATGVSGGIVATGAAPDTEITFTFSGTGYAALPQPSTLISVVVFPTSTTSATVVQTTAGVDGRFVTASLVAATDGSENPRGILDDGYGLKVTDDTGTSQDQMIDGLVIGGYVDTSQICDVPSDTALLAYLKAQMRANSGNDWIFDDDV